MKADLELHRVIGRKIAPRDYGWGRPVDWPDVAPYEDGDEGFTGLALIPEQGATLFIEMIATTSGIMGQIDWGDGSAPEDIVSDTLYSHAYTYSAVPGEIVPSVGAKIAKVVFTIATGKSIREIYLTRGGTTDKSTIPWLDVHAAGPNVEKLWPHYGMMTYLRALQGLTFYGSNKIGGISFNFSGYPSLRYIKFRSSEQIGVIGSSFSDIFYNLYALAKVDIDWEIVSGSVGNFLSGCYALIESPPINAPNATSVTNLFYNCYNLLKVGPISFPLNQNSSGMFYNNYSLKKIPAIDFNNVTSASNFAINCYSLEVCDLYNIGCSIAFTNTRLFREELVKIFGNLKTVSGQTITITGSAGAAALTPEDRAIATDKGWTISG